MRILSALRYLGLVVVLSGAYYLANRLGLFLRISYGGLSPLWPAAGVGVALLWLYGLRWWPVILIGEVLSARYLGQSWVLGLSGGVSQLLEGLVATAFLTRLKVDSRFQQTRDPVLFLLFASLLPPVVSATLGTTGLWINGIVPGGQLLNAGFTWWLGDAMGILIATPFIAQWRRWPFASVGKFAECAGWLLLIGGCAYLILTMPRGNEASLFFLLLPLVVLAAVRSGSAGASSSAALLAGTVLLLDRNAGPGEFDNAVRIAFVGATAFTGYVVAAAFAERRHASAELDIEQERALVTLQALGEGVISTRADGRVHFMNSIAERLTSWNADDARGKPIEEIFPLTFSDTRNSDSEPENTVRHCLRRGTGPAILSRRLLRDRTGKLRPVEGAISLVHSSGGVMLGGVVVFRDISEAEQLRERLLREATHDSLTGLRNRAAFDHRLRELTDTVRDSHRRYALLYLDLDQFKLINDTRGHEIGDRLLVELTRQLRGLVHHPDVIARLGGDEFGVLLLDTDEQRTLQLAERLRRAVLDYQFKERELTFTVGVSIGVTFFSAGDRAPEVLSRADIACYIAKESGRNAIHVYRSDDANMLQHHSDLARVSQLQTAMNDGHFRLFGQRIERLDGKPANGKGRFYEVLLRLMESDTVVSPSAFLPVAARYGLSTIIDNWVMEESFKLLGDQRLADARLSINLTPRTIDGPEFLQRLKDLTGRYRVTPQRVCFEVTENVAFENLTRAVETMHRLSKEGYRFALDDFGTGVASFSYLQSIPVHYVKIDGSFVQNFADDPANPLIIRSLAELARLRGIECIAECVENEHTKHALQQLGVSFGQGYFLHKPEPFTLRQATA
ncbi:MAG TPA: EAL domain-containing protein [Gammaproteobacteria bacterium]|nr:EAL domain-containing protein [Gammaproteobacteria bacterium]